VADTTQTIGQADLTRLKRRIQEMEQRFPELSVQLVMHHFPREHPFSMHIFWLFNAGAFASESRRGASNHGLLIAVDPLRQEAAIMPGYGLEPFLKEETIGHLLDLASPAWEEGQWTDGFLRVLNSLDKLLESVAQPITTGIPAENDF